MIKLSRTNPPSKLTQDKIDELTKEFKMTGNSVWRKTYIQRALSDMSHNKCAFCECKLGEESKYMEVEHFYYKDKYKERVVEWDNLLPACKRCNISKSTHDVGIVPIINPCKEEPNEHMLFKAYRFYKKADSELGKNTIEVLDLNNHEKVVMSRFLLGEKIVEKIEEILGLMDGERFNETDVRLRNKIIRGISTVLKYSDEEEEYSATMASIIYNDENYKEIKRKLIEKGWWSEEMNNRDLHMKKIKFDNK